MGVGSERFLLYNRHYREGQWCLVSVTFFFHLDQDKWELGRIGGLVNKWNLHITLFFDTSDKTTFHQCYYGKTLRLV